MSQKSIVGVKGQFRADCKDKSDASTRLLRITPLKYEFHTQACCTRKRQHTIETTGLQERVVTDAREGETRDPPQGFLPAGHRIGALVFFMPYFTLRVSKTRWFLIDSCNQFRNKCPKWGFWRKGLQGEISDSRVCHPPPCRVRRCLGTESFGRCACQKQGRVHTNTLRIKCNPDISLTFLKYGLKNSL